MATSSSQFAPPQELQTPAVAHKGQFEALADPALAKFEDLGADALRKTGLDDLDLTATDNPAGSFDDATKDNGGAMVPDKDGPLVPRKKVSELFFDRATMASVFDFNEPMYTGQNWDYAEFITQRYDAEDGIASDKLKLDTLKHSLATKNFAIVTLLDAFNRQVSFGAGLQGAFEGATGFIKLRFQIASQLPAIHLTVKRGENKPEVDVYYFANCLQRDQAGDPMIEFKYARGRLGVEIDQGCIELGWHQKNNNLLQVSFQLDTFQTEGPPTGIKRSRPVFQGITEAELIGLYERLPQTDVESCVLDPPDHFLAMLYVAGAMDVYRFWPVTEEAFKKVDHFARWMGTAFNMCSHINNHWFYEMQRAENALPLEHFDFPLKDLAMPRWLGKKWLVDCDEAGLPIGDPKVVHCGAFPEQATKVYPDRDSMAFELRLGLVRDQAHVSHILRSSFQANSFKIRGAFKAHPRRPGFYVVELRTHDNSLLAKDRTLRPTVDTRIELEVLDTVTDTEGDVTMGDGNANATAKVKKFPGLIAEDIFGSRAECVVVVEGPTLDLSKSSERYVKVTCKDDPTPTRRMLATVETIAQGLNRNLQGVLVRQGVDIPGLVLRAPLEIQATNSLAYEVFGRDDSAKFLALFESVLDLHLLNKEQHEAAVRSFQSQSGFSIVKGPPGTGKTWTLMVIALAMIEVGKALNRRRPVIACAPSNIAVDTMLEKFVGMKSSHNLVVVRYRGSMLREKKAAAAPAQPTDAMDVDTAADAGGEKAVDPDSGVSAQELQEALWELADEARPFGDEPNEAYGFYVMRLAAVQRWANTPAHALHTVARQYLDFRGQMKRAHNLSKDKKKQVREEFADLEVKVTEYWMENEVDIVFCTNSSSAHGILRTTYKPRVLISDEAAVTPLPDCATPMGACMDFVELIVMGGDDQQQQPIVASKGANEVHHLLGTSLFSFLWTSSSIAHSQTELRVQHRMHPALSKPISTYWYGGRLKDHAGVVARTSKKWNTLQDYLARLRPAWNGRRRIGVDVSGDGVVSEPYNDSTSHCNIMEARFVCKFMEGAIAHTPPVDGEPIQASDFLVLSTYSGQSQLIGSVLTKSGVNKAGNKARISSTRAIQGEEAPFVIISMTRNDKDKPLTLGLVSDSHALNVGMSRPQEFLMVAGNFQAWAQAHADKAGVLVNSNGSMYRFGQIVNDFRVQKDLISCQDWVKFMNGETITEPGFPKLIVEGRGDTGVASGRGGRGGGQGRGGGGQGRGGGGQGRGGSNQPRGGSNQPRGGSSRPPADPRDRFGTHEQKQGGDKKKPARRPQNKPPNGPRPPPPSGGAAGSTAAAS